MSGMDHIALSRIHQVAACHGDQPLQEWTYDYETGAITEHELGEGGDRAATRKHLERIVEGMAGLLPEDGNQQKAFLASFVRGIAYRAMGAVERAERAMASLDQLCGNRRVERRHEDDDGRLPDSDQREDQRPQPGAHVRPVAAYSLGADLRDLGYDPGRLAVLVGSEVTAMRMCSAKDRADCAWVTAGSLACLYQDAEAILARMGIEVLPPRQQGSHFQSKAREIAGLNRKD